ncbi:cold-shock DNA-binding protein family protein [Cupriavidus basilensis OR16]|uniref:Cold-shock DNA-binding protein family protein n=1 Tax=Cupriavidus basilensis OR16 TaxID=1127483 RepID=H1S3S6_9BURK|nr:cold shock domain-containing protein [Cupriavidus basilensis]EHP42850.1 cold-shock DNA-binding protein family protein [Cupriavidus basilensis OR16]
MDTRIDGTLKTWNKDKGFGFITSSNGGQDIFVHISDYPRQGGQPRVGESLSFLVTHNKDGKKKAINVQRPGGHPALPRRSRTQAPVRQGTSFRGLLVGFIAVAILFAAGYKYVAPMFGASETLASASGSVKAPTAAAPSLFQCDGRTHCSQMTSCKEATYFLKNCPNTKMDGDGDGIPCESQWCTSIFSK